MLRLKDLFKIDFSSKGGGKLADKIFNKYNITKEEREEVKNEIASSGTGGDSEEVWYIRKRGVNGVLSNDTLDTLSNFSNSLCLIEAYIEWYSPGGASLTKKPISNYKNENGGYKIEAFKISPSYLFMGNGLSYLNIQDVESLFKEYLNLSSGGQIPPEMEEEINNVINIMMEDINHLYYTGTKQEMLAYLESIYNN